MVVFPANRGSLQTPDGFTENDAMGRNEVTEAQNINT